MVFPGGKLVAEWWVSKESLFCDDPFLHFLKEKVYPRAVVCQGQQNYHPEEAPYPQGKRYQLCNQKLPDVSMRNGHFRIERLVFTYHSQLKIFLKQRSGASELNNGFKMICINNRAPSTKWLPLNKGYFFLSRRTVHTL